MSSHYPRSAWIPALLATLACVASVQAQELQPLDDLRGAAERFVSARLNGTGSAAIVHATAGALDSRLRLARCAQPLEAFATPGMRDGARMTVGVRCNQPAWTVYVPVLVETEQKVLMLRQAAPRNATLGPADVELASRRVPGIAAHYLTDPGQLERRHLRMPAAPGTPLTQELFAADVLIRRGQRVTLVAAVGGIEVRAQGEAMADATAGGRVRVLNLSSRRIVEGQVESADQVRVNL